jgi:hypothetical protein
MTYKHKFITKTTQEVIKNMSLFKSLEPAQVSNIIATLNDKGDPMYNTVQNTRIKTNGRRDLYMDIIKWDVSAIYEVLSLTKR